MRNILALVGAATVAFLALGWYLGWYKVSSVPSRAGNRRCTWTSTRRRLLRT